MKNFFRIISGLTVAGVVALLVVILVPLQRSPPLAPSSAEGGRPSKIVGKQIAIAADCIACHTTPNGKPFAGGRALASPFGVIYSTNITPDKASGIGNYSLDDFRAVLYDGLRKDGALLYPAMPYPSYRKMTENDIRALYAYLMEEVEPAEIVSSNTRLAFPFNQRWGLRLWNWVALPKVGFVPYMGEKILDRGAYLVEALTHCGTCHSPRSSLTFAEKGYDSRSADFLAGGIVDVWPAPDLRAANSNVQRWSNEQLASLLIGGRNETSGVSGEMALVTEHSLQYLPKTDIDAIVAYIKAIRQDSGKNSSLGQSGSNTTKQLASASPDLDFGARLYLDNCNACHFADGKGATNIIPHLDGNSLVISENPGGLISVILNGASIPSTTLYPEKLAMPGFGWRLKDDEVVALASFVRRSWSNNAKAVTKSDVSKIRGVVAQH